MKILEVRVFDASLGQWCQRIENLPLLGFIPMVVLLGVNFLLLRFSNVDATWQLVLDQTQGLALCLGIFSTVAACYKKFNTALILAALKWIGSGRVGYLYTSTIHTLMCSLRAIFQRMEIQSIQAAVRFRIALGIAHPSLFARLIPTPILRRA